MQKKITVAIVVAVLAVAGYIGWVHLRFQVMFRMKCQDVMEKKIGRFPKPSDLIALPDLVKEAAQLAHVPTEGLNTTAEIEGRDMGPVRFYFLIVHVTQEGKSLDFEQRIESQNSMFDAAEDLEQHGIKIRK